MNQMSLKIEHEPAIRMPWSLLPGPMMLRNVTVIWLAEASFGELPYVGQPKSPPGSTKVGIWSPGACSCFPAGSLLPAICAPASGRAQSGGKPPRSKQLSQCRELYTSETLT